MTHLVSIVLSFEMESSAKPENNFKCEICEKIFLTNQNKNQHIKSAHGEAKIFTCNVCNSRYYL